MKKSLAQLMYALCVCSLCFVAGCGGGKAIALTFPSGTMQAVDNGQSLAITVKGAGPKGVMWTLASFGMLSNITTTSVTYVAPTGPPATPVMDHLTATSLDDSTKHAMLTITVNAVPSISTTQAQLTSSPATVGNAYTFTFAATGGSGTLTWSATGLPSWLSISAAGVLSGTPPAGSTGTVNFSVTVTDSSAAGAQSNTKALSITVNQASAITSANNVTFVVGTAGTFTVTATGTPTPTLSESGTLPSAVTFNP